MEAIGRRSWALTGPSGRWPTAPSSSLPAWARAHLMWSIMQHGSATDVPTFDGRPCDAWARAACLARLALGLGIEAWLLDRARR
eukprot:2050314-Pyramimonas_sp.AAC.1